MGLEPTTLKTLYSRQSALPAELPRQHSWLGPNLTSHSTPDEQANHQLSMYSTCIHVYTCTVHACTCMYVCRVHACACMYVHVCMVHACTCMHVLMYQLSYQGSTAGWAQISHLIVHLMNRLTINSACTVHAYTYTYVPYTRVHVCVCMYVGYMRVRVCMYMYVGYMRVRVCMYLYNTFLPHCVCTCTCT